MPPKRNWLRSIFDFLLSIAIIPGAYLMLFFRVKGGARFPQTHKRLQSIGVYPMRDHYYEPLFNVNHLQQALDVPRNLPNLDLCDEAQLALLRSMDKSDEFVAFVEAQKTAAPGAGFTIKNEFFEGGDACFFHQFIRHTKPSKIIEIGGGFSTRVANGALKLNAQDGAACDHICIEPYEQPWLEKLSDVTLVRKLLQDLDFNWSETLGPGDILFVDSSHIIRPQGDVLKIYLEILPLLPSGVVVHVHDIFTPRDYLRTWIEDDARLWNEQYLLEALLQNDSRYEIVAALNYQKHENFGDLKRVCPYLTPQSEPGSFYFRVK